MKFDNIEIQAMMAIEYIIITLALLLPKIRGTHHAMVITISLVGNTLFFPGSLLGFSSPKT